jgi:cytochrome c biogenesis protein ResB
MEPITRKNSGKLVWLWRSLGSVRLAVVLLILLVIDLSLAYFSINGRSIIFEPMNQVGIWPWLNTYAMANLRYTAWFFIFLVLLSALVLNTLVCTTDRLWKLLRQRKEQKSNKRFFFALSTHTMHLGMVVILIGYLISYTMSQVYPSLTLIPQKETIVAGTNLRVKLTSMTLPIYEGKRLETFTGMVISPSVQLRVATPATERTASLGFNNPVYFQGYTFFLQRFSPTKNANMSNAHYIVIDVRRDPGVLFYFVGISFFLGGLLCYVIFWIRSRQPRRVPS